jgi:hypothetical protein
MHTDYQAQWVSRRRMNELKKAGLPGKAVLLNHLNGGIVVGRAGSDLGDGPALSAEEADYELQAAWVSDSQATLRQARERLGLGAVEAAPVGV